MAQYLLIWHVVYIYMALAILNMALDQYTIELISIQLGISHASKQIDVSCKIQQNEIWCDIKKNMSNICNSYVSHKGIGVCIVGVLFFFEIQKGLSLTVCRENEKLGLKFSNNNENKDTDTDNKVSLVGYFDR